MRKILLSIVVLFVLITTFFILVEKLKPGFIRGIISSQKASQEQPSSFSNFTSYVNDEDLGLFPGSDKVNEGTKDFFNYLNNQENSAKIFDVYKMFIVEKEEESLQGRFLLSSEGSSASYSFECTPDRTSAHKATNLEFISSGFDFNTTVKAGDMVFTKCKNEVCTLLGPDCILVKTNL